MIIFMCTAFRSDFARSTQTAVTLQQHLQSQLLQKAAAVPIYQQELLQSKTHHIIVYYINVPVLQKHDYRAKIYTATCNCLVLHRPALSDGCRHTVWISSILSRPVADLIHLGDHISSCSSDPFADQLAVQLVLAFHFCASATNQCSSKSVVVYIIPSDSVVYFNSGFL